MHKDFITFKATHSLFVNTNYVPAVVERVYLANGVSGVIG
jgi:hypothetical protein